MMHSENGYYVEVRVSTTSYDPHRTLKTRVQVTEAERIALAAAVDALRGPKAEPGNCDGCARDMYDCVTPVIKCKGFEPLVPTVAPLTKILRRAKAERKRLIKQGRCPECEYEYPRSRTDGTMSCDECGHVWSK